ncbi:TlpA disulfide reductase family protein [Pedobacter gandavensis]|uniref:TlpA family protein disulfide reductase n=1 Tax=Pedobacter gandavensis TaxID=2679963 RepID=UPI00292DF994|nr:TlpA disulfide reductase family protein [Pedobacter gandavensis]
MENIRQNKVLILTIVLLFNCFAFNNLVSAQKYAPANVKISGVLKSNHKDSIELIYKDCKFAFGESLVLRERKQINAISDDGKFKFEIKTKNPVYVSLVYKSNNGAKIQLFTSYLAERGDDINVVVTTDSRNSNFSIQSLMFKGKGAGKYTCQYLIDQNEKNNLGDWQKRPNSMIEKGLLEGLKHAISFVTVLDHGNGTILQKNKSSMSDFAFDLVRVNLYSKKMFKIYKQLYIKRKQIHALNSGDKGKFLKWYLEEIRSKVGFPNRVLPLSMFYTSFLLRQFQFENLALNDKGKWIRINNITDRKLKERLLTEYILTDFTEITDQKMAIEAALKSISDKDYIELIKTTANTQSKGSNVFDFSLPDSSGRFIKLSQFLGKVVFLDFWFTGCAGCGSYHKLILSKVEKAFEKDSTVVFITISVDKNKEKWIKSVNEGEYTSLSAINLYTNGLGVNHPIINHFAVTSYPRPIIIDKKGKLFNNTESDLRSSVERLSALLLEAKRSN